MKFLDKIAANFFQNDRNSQKTQVSDNVKKDENYYVNYYVRDILDATWNGDKFFQSYGTTKDYTFVDYYLLRKRSVQLIKEKNLSKNILKALGHKPEEPLESIVHEERNFIWKLVDVKEIVALKSGT